MAEDGKQLVKSMRATIGEQYSKLIVDYRDFCEKIAIVRKEKERLRPIMKRLDELNRKVKTQELTAEELAEVQAL